MQKSSYQSSYIGNNQGFTLIEVLFTLVILSILLASTIPRFEATIQNVLAKSNESEIRRIEEGASLYYLDLKRYPRTITDLVVAPNEEDSWKGPYLNVSDHSLFYYNERYGFDDIGRIVIH